MIELKYYQAKYVNKLVDDVQDLLRAAERSSCVFQSPTGSGKTIMMAECLKKLAIENSKSGGLSFIWISVRKLHDQSKDKLERYFEDSRSLTCSYFQDLTDKKISENEILFVNWESINKLDKNTIIKENEQEFYLNKVIENTKEEGREIILIIDESHHTAKSPKSKAIIDSLDPHVTIEVSATPHLIEDVGRKITVPLNDVKEEEMIKTEVSVNPEFLNLKTKPTDSDQLVMKQGLEKKAELVKKYKKEGAKVNPLLMIQLPDKKQGLESKKDRIVKYLKDEFNITEENGKLAIWLSEQKSETLANIEKNENDVEVLIFKKAIALGWDCPRASILLIFRESKSFMFTIQTIGRIMRMPELKHYKKEPELNKGFIFTNLANIKITEDYAKDYVTIYESKRRDNVYKSLSLPSVHLKRQRERTRLSGNFTTIFQDVAKRTKLKSKIKSKPAKIVNEIIADGKIINIDKTGEIEGKGTVSAKLSDYELQNRFNEFIRIGCSPYAPVDSSDRVKMALYQFLNKELKIKKYDSKAQELILSSENVQHFIDTINLAKEEYKNKVVEPLSEKREIENIPNWEVPPRISYNSKYKKERHPVSVMQPFRVRKPSKIEERFMTALDKSNKVKWWFRNGEVEIKYFAVPYKDEHDFDRAFYVDFVVMFKDGYIGLLDTKEGRTAEDAGPKAEGLQRYISAQAKRKKVWGGIVIQNKGTWRYNNKKKYAYNPNNLSAWNVLEL
ncbi:DEAD/DEAH box helicase [Nanoarchaeota archaeon]